MSITLPRGETPVFAIAHRAEGPGWAEAGIIKDAGDDPDVTHGALIVARVAPSAEGLVFRAGAVPGQVQEVRRDGAAQRTGVGEQLRQQGRRVCFGQPGRLGQRRRVGR